MVDLAPHFRDFSDTAHALATLDLLVTVDTSVAHLAGSMGVRTHLLLPFFPDWRWLMHGRDCAWYPQVQLHRQPAPGAWGPVLEDLARELAHGA
jgi:ADP-heptose:LPS heptosyltransferase